MSNLPNFVPKSHRATPKVTLTSHELSPNMASQLTNEFVLLRITDLSMNKTALWTLTVRVNEPLWSHALLNGFETIKMKGSAELDFF